MAARSGSSEPPLGDGEGGGAFHDIRGFSGHESADPFPVEHPGGCYVFFEDLVPPDRRGRLAVLELDHDLSASAPRAILERDYHLSYPCVFEEDGEYFMIPESADNRTVDLYRAERMPDCWKHEATLCAGPALVDTTPLRRDGLWYFFTTAVLPGGVLLDLLFLADSLTGAWRPHPASPIAADARATRNAGHIFLHQGRWIRPVQDCARRYGYAVVFREILELTPDRFRERTVGELRPTWRSGLLATHTWNQAGGFEIRDGSRGRRTR